RLPHGERRGRGRGHGAADPPLCVRIDRVVTDRADLRSGRSALLRPRRAPRRTPHVACRQVRPAASRPAGLALALSLLELLPALALRGNGRRTPPLAPVLMGSGLA